MAHFAQILLPLALNESFTYRAVGNFAIGDIVLVEFGRKKLWGVIVDLNQAAPNNLDEAKIKEILAKNERIRLSLQQLQFIENIASYNIASRGLILRSVIGILNSDKTKKEPIAKTQKIDISKFNLKKLSAEQQQVFDKLQNITKEEKSAISLIDGVTGSGKTEIYFAEIAKILQEEPEAQIVILLPEIALTSQLLTRFQSCFGFEPALWHSKISKKQKREFFYGIAEGSLKVMIGARSALLLPFKNLRLIVIDEEHDQSFKQEDVFNFHARDMAILKAKIDNFPVILSSATPAIETYSNAVSGKFYHFILSQKFSQKQNEIELIDLRQNKLENGQFLSGKLREEIAENLAKNKQSLLFLNRRGYAPLTLCKACGTKYECPNCDFHLVLHKKKNLLVCHYCGHNEKLEKTCQKCGAENEISSVGVGVEKLAEEVQATFPQARIALITSDNISSFDEVDAIVKKITNREVDIIIGTQMIAKGHDFPALNLVGIIDADAMFFSSELKSLERAYQMMTQVIGRAGRHEDSGKIIIQTYNPTNLLLEKVIKGDKQNFYEFELKNRKALEAPPFSRFVKFEVSSFKENEAKNFAKKLIQSFPVNDKIELFGPAPAPLQKLKNRHHFLVNLKSQKKVNVQKLIADVMENLAIPNSIRIRINVDPT